MRSPNVMDPSSPPSEPTDIEIENWARVTHSLVLRSGMDGPPMDEEMPCKQGTLLHCSKSTGTLSYVVEWGFDVRLRTGTKSHIGIRDGFTKFVPVSCFPGMTNQIQKEPGKNKSASWDSLTIKKQLVTIINYKPVIQ